MKGMLVVIFLLISTVGNLLAQETTGWVRTFKTADGLECNFDGYSLGIVKDKLIVRGYDWLGVGLKQKGGWYSVVWSHPRFENMHGMAYQLPDGSWMISCMRGQPDGNPSHGFDLYKRTKQKCP